MYEIYDHGEGCWRGLSERERELIVPVIERDFSAWTRLRRGETLRFCQIGEMSLSRVQGDEAEIRMRF